MSPRWFRALTRSRSKNGPRRIPRGTGLGRGRFKASFEALEDRHLLASSITVVPGAAGSGDQDANLLADGQILFADPDLGGNTLSTGALMAIDGLTDIVVQSTGTILFNGGLVLNAVSGHTITLSTNTLGGGSISLGNLQTSGAGVTVDAATDLICGNLTAFQGDIVLRAGNQMTVNGLATLATITASANQDGVGSEGFIQGSGFIRSSSEADSAIRITVNTAAGGTGNATLRDIGWSTTGLVVDTYGGGILGGPLFVPGDTNVGCFQAILRGAFIGSLANPLLMKVAVLTTDTSGSNGDQWIRELDGLTELNLNAGSTGDINLVLDAGAIQSADAATDLTAERLTLTAATGISANISALLLEATNTTAGNIELTQAALPARSLTTTGMGVRNLAPGGLVMLTNLGEGINVAAASPIQTSNGNITLAALDFNIQGAINSGSAITTLANSTHGRLIDLGNNTSGSIGLTDTELDLVTASVLRLGSAIAGNMNITARISQQGAGYAALSLLSGGELQSIGGGITVENLAIQAPLVILGSCDVANLAGTSRSVFHFHNADNLNVSTVDGIVGITATSTFSSFVQLFSSSGGATLTISQPIFSNVGGVILRFDDMAINAPITGLAGAIESGFVGIVQLRPTTANRTIDLGAAFGGAALHLSDAELDLVNADRYLHIGRDSTNTYGIILSAPITQMGSGYTALRLETRGTIVDATAGEQADVTVSSLAVLAGGGIGAADNLDVMVSNLAFKNTGDAVNISNVGALAIGDVAFLTTSSNSGTTTAIATSGLLTIAVDVTCSGDLMLAALDFNILAAINSGTAITTLASSASGRKIILGETMPDAIGLTDTELDQVTASVLRIGSASGGNINLTSEITQAGSGYGALSLRSAGEISQSGGSFLIRIAVDDLALDADSIVLETSNSVSNLAGISRASRAHSFGFAASGDLTIGTVDGISGITSTSLGHAGINLFGGFGTTLTISQAISANRGSVSILFDDVVIDAPITASGTGSGGLGTVNLRPVDSFLPPIDLGGLFQGTALHLSDAELDRITAEGGVRLGLGIRADILVSALISQEGSGYSSLLLYTIGAIVDASATEQADLRVTDLVLLSGAGIGAENDLDLAVSNLAFRNTAGDVNISNSGALTIDAVGDLMTSFNVGGTTTITAASPLTFAVDVTTTGHTIYTAGETNDFNVYADNLTVNRGVTIQVTAGNLTLQAGDHIRLNSGSTVKASGTVTLNIGLNDLDNYGRTDIAGTIDAGTGIPNVLGTPAHDTVVIDFTAGAHLPDNLRFDGGDHPPGLGDGVSVLDRRGTASRTYRLDETGVTRDSAAIVSIERVEFVFVQGGDLPDMFHVKPAVGILFNVFGGLPPGDMLDIDFSGTTDPFLLVLNPPIELTGDYRFGNRAAVAFAQMNVLSPVPDLRIDFTDEQASASPGSRLTYTLHYANVGEVGALGVVLTETLPAGTTFDPLASDPRWTETTPGAGVFKLNIGPVGAGASGDAKFVVRVGHPTGQEIVNTASVSYAGSVVDADPIDNTASITTRVDNSLTAVGADAGGPARVRVFNGDGTQRFAFLAYAAPFTGGVRVALGDITGDGIQDIITAPGPGAGPHVRVFDGATGQPLPGMFNDFFAYAPGFMGGVFVSSGDVNGDDRDDILVAPGPGMAPIVRVFSGVDGAEIARFAAFEPPWAGGVSLAAGDINADGNDDIVVGRGRGGAPEVRVFSGADFSLLRSFLAYSPAFTGGVHVAVGDMNGDGNEDIITGPGRGGGPQVRAFSGDDGSRLASFFAFDRRFTGGVRVAAADVNGDGLDDFVVGAGQGGGPQVRTFSGGGDSLTRLDSFFAFPNTFRGGVFVAAAPHGSEQGAITSANQQAIRAVAVSDWETPGALGESLARRKGVGQLSGTGPLQVVDALFAQW